MAEKPGRAIIQHCPGYSIIYLALCPARRVDARRAKPCEKPAISSGLRLLGLFAQPAGLMSDGHSLARTGQAGAFQLGCLGHLHCHDTLSLGVFRGRDFFLGVFA